MSGPLGGNIEPALRPHFQNDGENIKWRAEQDAKEAAAKAAAARGGDLKPTVSYLLDESPVAAPVAKVAGPPGRPEPLTLGEIEARAREMEDNARAIRSCLDELRRRVGC